jgi:hypothetical protein
MNVEGVEMGLSIAVANGPPDRPDDAVDIAVGGYRCEEAGIRPLSICWLQRSFFNVGDGEVDTCHVCNMPRFTDVMLLVVIDIPMLDTTRLMPSRPVK